MSFCSLIRFNWRVPARVPLFSLGLKVPRSPSNCSTRREFGSPCGHSGRLSEVMLTHYRRREVRNLIYRYRKIHIDYRSKFSYRFISSISIIYGNTKFFIYSLFVTTYDVNFHFFPQTFRHNGSTVFGTMPLMCRSCPDVNKLRGMDTCTTILGQHQPFMSIKLFVQHSSQSSFVFARTQGTSKSMWPQLEAG